MVNYDCITFILFIQVQMIISLCTLWIDYKWRNG